MMTQDRMSRVQALLATGKSKGIDVSFSDDKLIARLPTDRAGSEHFLDELRVHRGDVIEYFKYWEVTPFHVYWLDGENEAFKGKLQVHTAYKMSGGFSIDLFREAFRFLIKRHESLRACFVKIGEKHYMTVGAEDAEMYGVEYENMLLPCFSAERMDAFIHFRDHVFDLERGPLIKARVAMVGEGEFIVAFRIHHVIYDGWSLDVMTRDLFTAYTAFSGGRSPLLPTLRFQYKEFMAMSNRHAEANQDAQLRYWHSLYSGLPGMFRLPGQKEVDGLPLVCRHGSWVKYEVPGEMYSLLGERAVGYNVSLFILLMALFKFFLFRLTGQRDLVIGTMSFGRDRFDGLVDQIGYFAYTDLIRTVFSDSDRFEDALERVKKANQDMKRNDVSTLMAYTVGLLPEGAGVTTAGFWRVNLHYSDVAGFYQDSEASTPSGSQGIRMENFHVADTITETDLDMKVYFFNRRDGLEISVHYDCDLYDEAAVDELVLGYQDFIRESIR
jgi:hypothetical protein